MLPPLPVHAATGCNRPTFCYQSITIQYGGNTQQATIKDECPTCAWGSLDMSQSLFQAFASLDAGVFQMTWWFNDGSNSGGGQQTTTTQPAWTPDPTTSTPAWTPDPTTPTTTYTPPSTTSTTSPSSTPSPTSTTSSTPPPTSSSSSSITVQDVPTTSAPPENLQKIGGAVVQIANFINIAAGRG